MSAPVRLRSVARGHWSTGLKVLLIGVLWCVMGSASAAPFVEADTRLTFADECAGWQRIGVTEYPQKELGCAVGYRNPDGKMLHVYVYPAGGPAVPSGGENPLIEQGIRQVAAEVTAVWTGKGGEVEEILPAAVVRETHRATGLAMITAHRIRLDGQTLLSISGLTGYRGKYLKLRYTYTRGLLDEGVADLRQFIAGLMAANQASLDPFFSPAPAEAPAAAGTVTRFVLHSPDVTMAMGVETVPWLIGPDVSAEPPGQDGLLLLAAYYAGNAEAQLSRGVARDEVHAGWLAVLRAYAQIQAARPVRMASVERLKALHEAGELEAHARAVEAAIASAATGAGQAR